MHFKGKEVPSLYVLPLEREGLTGVHWVSKSAWCPHSEPWRSLLRVLREAKICGCSRSSLGILQMTTGRESSPRRGSFLLCSQGNSTIQAHRVGIRAAEKGQSPLYPLPRFLFACCSLSGRNPPHHDTLSLFPLFLQDSSLGISFFICKN